MSNNSSMMVDTALTHDILPQDGAGNEPIDWGPS